MATKRNKKSKKGQVRKVKFAKRARPKAWKNKSHGKFAGLQHMFDVMWKASKKKMTYEQFEKAQKKNFPQSRFNRASWSWLRSVYAKQGYTASRKQLKNAS